jgi:hypothetical protein
MWGLIIVLVIYNTKFRAELLINILYIYQLMFISGLLH